MLKFHAGVGSKDTGAVSQRAMRFNRNQRSYAHLIVEKNRKTSDLACLKDCFRYRQTQDDGHKWSMGVLKQLSTCLAPRLTVFLPYDTFFH